MDFSLDQIVTLIGSGLFLFLLFCGFMAAADNQERRFPHKRRK